jgi:hypothetical protein
MPDEDLFQYSHGTLVVCEHQGDAGLAVIGIESVKAVVGMVPFGEHTEGHNRRYFLAEKPGLDVYEQSGGEDSDDDV